MQYVSYRAWSLNNENDKFFEITDITHKKQQYTLYCVLSVDETGWQLIRIKYWILLLPSARDSSRRWLRLREHG